ncbi:MAG TPA: M23 family metallopeptidase, partial [Myxococcota bacterium]|nr:M23 family metallopeptidase [Myxococcota bacterium]
MWRVLPVVSLCLLVACEVAEVARDTGGPFETVDPGDTLDTSALDGEVVEDTRLDTQDTGDTNDSTDTKLEDPDAHPCPEWERPPATRLWHQDEVAPLALRLPLPDGVEATVTQGNDGEFSHFADQRFAWDFAVPYGTAVHAAATGVVVWVEDTQVGAGPGVEWRELANFIVLDHGGGLFSSYVHLAVGSAMVGPGDVVLAGQVLAETGESGQLTGPHLHFQVENVWSESVPAVFARGLGCDWVPMVGEQVIARPVRLSTEAAVSELPAGSFEEDGVVDAVGLPARLLSRSES